MICKATMLKHALLAIKNAPNDDWRNRGDISLVGDLRELPVKGWNNKTHGNVTVGFYKFSKPLKDEIDDNRNCAFIGFTIAVDNQVATSKKVYATHPVIGKIKDEDYENPPSRLASRFCPQCGRLDSVKQRSRRVGPECAHITYFCKCGYKDFDVFD